MAELSLALLERTEEQLTAALAQEPAAVVAAASAEELAAVLDTSGVLALPTQLWRWLCRMSVHHCATLES